MHANLPAGSPAAILSQSPDALIAVSPDGRVRSWFGAAERLFGWAADEVLGQPIGQLLDGSDAHWWLGAVQERTAFQSQCRCKDGRAVPVDALARRVWIDGAFTGVVVTLRPVEKHAPSLELELLLSRFRGLLEAAPDAMVIVDAAGQIEMVNEQAIRLFGHARHEIVGQPVEILVPERFRARHPEFRDRYFQAPRPRPMGEGIELAALRRDGSEFPAEISLSPVEIDAGMMVTAAVRDVTERKRLEARKEEEREEQNRRLSEASRLKSEFLANMSHELRTPLNAVIGFANILNNGLAGPMSEQQHEYLGDILTSANHLLQLINDVLDVAKIEAGKMEFHPEIVTLPALVDSVCEAMRALADARGVRIRADVHPAVARVSADPARLKQILYNFLSNAVKFSHENGAVDVRVLPAGGECFRVEVQDRGIGIEAADLARLFVEFQQLDSGPDKRHGGTGLGLAFTRRLVEAQGGTVGVSSEPGRGSTFYAVLPGGPP